MIRLYTPPAFDAPQVDSEFVMPGRSSKTLYKAGMKGVDRVWITKRNGAYVLRWVEVDSHGKRHRRSEQVETTKLREAQALANAKSQALRQGAVVPRHRAPPVGTPTASLGHSRWQQAPRSPSPAGAPQPHARVGGLPYGSVGWACEEYRVHRLPNLPTEERGYQERVIEMFERFFGREHPLDTLDKKVFGTYIRARSMSAEQPNTYLFPELIGADLGPVAPRRRVVLPSGAEVVVPPDLLPAETLRLAMARAEYEQARRLGKAVPKPSLLGWRWPEPVGARSIERESKTIRTMLKFALEQAEDVWRLPLRCRLAGIVIPKPDSVHTPIIEQDELERLLAAAPSIHPDLEDLMHVCDETGRRISSVLALHSGDLNLEATPPRIVWSRAKNRDLEDEVSAITVDLAARLRTRVAMLTMADNERDRRRPRALFPRRGATDPVPATHRLEPMSAPYARSLLDAAYDAAGLTRPVRGGYHMFRRAFATDMLEDREPEKTVMATGGWKDASVMRKYQKVRPRTQAAALARRMRRRKAEDSGEE